MEKNADKIIKERYGIEVEHIHAPKSYEEYFYTYFQRGKNKGHIYGFPYRCGAWCNSMLKISVLKRFNKEGIVQYLGICADETERIARLRGNCKSPAAEFGYTEADCMQLAKELNLLSPVYESATRSGCWFCHNQSIRQLRNLYERYPEYWALLQKWENDSPVAFRTDHTIADFSKRFEIEKTVKGPFKWKMIDE